MNSFEIARYLKGKASVVALDELPRSEPTRAWYYVVNTDKRSGRGKHWFCIGLNERGEGEVFDSLGSSTMPEEALAWMRKNCGTRWKRNSERLQSKGSDMCGVYVIFHVNYRHCFRSLEQFVKLNFVTTNLIRNDSLMYDFII